MKIVVEYRAEAALCRQLAICEPMNSGHWLAEAEKWSRLAEETISSYFEECNLTLLKGATSLSKIAA